MSSDYYGGIAGEIADTASIYYAAGAAAERANIRAELAEYTEGVAADMGGSSAAFAVLREFARLLEGGDAT